MKLIQQWHAADSAATEQCGEEVARMLQGPMTIALLGEMGAGKTHWVKGFARALGYSGEVTSPTFALVQEYHGGRMPIFHFDLYRLQQAEEVLQLGWDDYCDQAGVMLVEWADLFPQLLPESRLVIKIEQENTGRKISLFQTTETSDPMS